MSSWEYHCREYLKRTKSFIATAALFALATLVFAFTSPVLAQGPDFNISSTPNGTCINLGSSTSYSITVSSLNGFEGNVALDISIDPNVANGPTLSPIPSSVSLTADQNVTFGLTASTSKSTPSQVYDITINGLSGDLVHSVTIYLAFEPLCGAAGGAVEPVNMISVITPYAGIAITIVGLTAATAALLYTRRRKPD
jgi:hypothetical protein